MVYCNMVGNEAHLQSYTLRILMIRTFSGLTTDAIASLHYSCCRSREILWQSALVVSTVSVSIQEPSGSRNSHEFGYWAAAPARWNKKLQLGLFLEQTVTDVRRLSDANLYLLCTWSPHSSDHCIPLRIGCWKFSVILLVEVSSVHSHGSSIVRWHTAWR